MTAAEKRVLLEVADLLLLAIDDGIVRGLAQVERLALLQRDFAEGRIDVETFEQRALDPLIASIQDRIGNEHQMG